MNIVNKILFILFLLALEGYISETDSDYYDGSMMTKTVTITLSVAAAYMVLVFGLMVYCRYQRRRRKQQYPDQGDGMCLKLNYKRLIILVVFKDNFVT